MSETLSIDPQTMRQKARIAAGLLKVLSNENRLMIVCHLGQGEMTVSEINERFDLSQSALSQHLAVLRKEGVVTTRRASQTIYYSLASPEAARLIEFMHGEFCS